ncbi:MULTISPECIES: M50 family metallopeptidase [Paenibacillus]|uniref:M50 family metallopeptidase n=1 Tax=Paenibacillus TaxID=44249 RepID=UPI0022B915EB|nr:M50 family metallopeptidase [Paenibacillus caseinilyticus]MCZ8519083.1 M50 family metallopeptidase [Paenibacillus caseinilyticus]
MNKGRRLRWNEWFGIRLRFHPLFSIMLLLSAVTGYLLEMATLFGIVFIHELGHIAAARGFGWRVREVQLLPFGGVAVVEETGGAPAREELAVALAGPLQNLWMMALAYGLISLSLLPPEWGHYFIRANLLIALFNLLPVLPLDGGKVMQVLLGLWLPYQRTLQAAASVSLILSGLLVTASVVHLFSERGGLQLNWLLIGIFLFYSNWYELKGLPYRFLRFLVHRGTSFDRKQAGGVLAGPLVVPGTRRISDVVALFMRDRYHLVYVMDGQGGILHVVPEQKVLECYFDEARRARTVAEVFA